MRRVWLETTRSPQAVRPAARRGITLIELLVVVSILMMLLVIAGPVLTPSLETRRLREAARAVNVFLGAARGQAMQSGRPVGVMLERLANTPQGAAVLYQAEMPPPYTGESMYSRIKVTLASAYSTPRNSYDCNITFGSMNSGGTWTPETPSITPLRGDVLQVGYQGPLWVITDSPSSGSTTWKLMTIENAVTMTQPPVTPPTGLPFQIFRQPQRSPAQSLQLPAGVVIDLTCSGHAEFFPNCPTEVPLPAPITIMFAPNGGLGWGYYQNSSTSTHTRQVIQTLYLLIGKRERLPVTITSRAVSNRAVMNMTAATSEDGRPNMADPDNFWISVNAQSGNVSAAPVAPIAFSYPANESTVSQSRRLLNDAQALGGK